MNRRHRISRSVQEHPLGAGFGVAAALAFGAASAVDARRIRRDPSSRLLADPPEGRKLDVRGADGTELHCDVLGPRRAPSDGSDAPTVVLVHGWTCCREFWAPQLNELSERYRVVAYDLRGHGRSAAPQGGDFSPEALADDLAAVLEAAVPQGQKALLVGHSLGAMSVVAWAGRYRSDVRERVAAALLLSTGTSDLVTESLLVKPPQRLSKPAEAVSRQAMAAAIPYGFPNPVTHRIVRYVALSPQATPAQVRFCERVVLACDRRWRSATARTLSRLDLDDAIEHLDVPTVVLGGSADRLTPPVLSERLASHLPQLVERVELSGVGHMTPVEAPEEVNGWIAELVKRHLSTEPAGQQASASSSDQRRALQTAPA
jgi:pimeloyl-ACP methyl ester carboxylesterase